MTALDQLITKYRLYVIALLGAVVTVNQQYPIIPQTYVLYIGAALAFFTVFNPTANPPLPLPPKIVERRELPLGSTFDPREVS
jgi:uncharacterized protein YqgC (DUF456 family)